MTDVAFEAWRQRARDADVLAVAQQLGVVFRKGGGKRDRAAPCPRCGGKDRFSVNAAKQVFNCRGAAGGDVIGMVMHIRAVDFLAACEIINGEPPPAQGTQLTPEALAAAEAAKAASAARAKRREADENRYREEARQASGKVYANAHPFAGSSAADYWALRGLEFPPTLEGRAERIKCVEAMPYVGEVGGDEKYKVVHTGPAKVVPIVDASRVFRGLHITYLDLAQPKGKLRLEYEGEILDAKKTRGSVGGNHVELIGPLAPRRLVLGEGDEKTVAVWQALERRARAGVAFGSIPLEQTAFWSACNLGNLAGPATDSIRHPTERHEKSGRAKNVAGLVPDLERPGISIPDSVVELVLLGDSTSDAFGTQVAMCRAAARYARPGLVVRVAWAPESQDFDDLWRLAANDAERDAAAAAIVEILEAAAWPQVPEGLGVSANPDQLINNGAAGAPARDSAHTGASALSPHQTGAGNAGAPDGLPAADTAAPGGDAPGPAEPDLGPEPPPPAAPPLAAESGNSSRSGGKSDHAPPQGPARGNAARSADRTTWAGPPRKYGEGEEALDRWLASFPLTDLGNVERFVQRQRGRLVYCPALGWHFWDGKRWSREGAEGRATIAEHETARAIQREAQAIVDTEFDVVLVPGTDKSDPVMLSDKLFAWGRTSENASRLNPMSKRAAASLAVETHALDSDPFKINVANGTLVVRREFTDADGDWRSWRVVSPSIRLKPHDPADLMTKISPVHYTGGAVCPTYDAFMDLVQPSRDIQRFIDDWNGYSLTGDASEQALVFHHGKGKNGKSTEIEIKLYIAGDYGRSVPIETFAQGDKARQAGQATPDLAMLHRVRAVSTSEPQKNWKLDEALIKVLTGGDAVPVRELFAKTYFMLKPEFKLEMNGNFKPRIDGGEADSGMWRRLKLVPWLVTIPKDLRDKHFGHKLKAEAAGILNRMLRGLERWMKTGLVDAAEIAAATEQFREDSDPLGRFLSFCTEPAPDERTNSTLLHQVFCAWAKSFGESEWKSNGFGRAMNERGFVSKKSDLNYWLGIKLVKGVNDFVDHQGNPLVLADASSGSNSAEGGGEPRPSGARGRREDRDDDTEGF